MQKITPCLWFDNQAEEAAQLYTSAFSNSNIGTMTPYDQPSAEVSGQPEGSALTVTFELAGQQFMALNGGPNFQFNPSISMLCKCTSAGEADELWQKLSAGGQILMPLAEYPFSPRYGWCADKYGLSWQINFVGAGHTEQKITPVLMFVGDVCGRAEEAITLYTSLFDDAQPLFIARHGPDAAPDVEGTIQHAIFTLAGQEFGAQDSAHDHHFAFNEAISFIVDCHDQREVDHFWEHLTAHGGEESMCGWLKDRFGVSWQIVPSVLPQLIGGDDQEGAQRATKAMLQMHKLDIAKLQEAYAG